MEKEDFQATKREDEGTGTIEANHTDCAKTLAELRLAISGNHSSAVRRCHLE